MEPSIDQLPNYNGANTGRQYGATEWLGVSITAVLLSMRLYARVYLHCSGGGFFNRESWRWSDILVLIAWINYLAYVILDSVWIHYGLYNYDLALRAAIWPDKYPEYWRDMAIYWKGSYAATFITLNTQYWVKLSMLCLYIEFTPVDMRKTLLCIKLLFGYVIISLLGGSLYWYLFCWPISLNWTFSISEGGNYGQCDLGLPKYWAPQMLLQVSTDILVWSLPFALISSLHFERRAAVVMFSIGLISVLSCTVFHTLNMISIFYPGNFPLQWAYSYLRIIDIGTAVAVACMPGIKTFARHFGIVEKVSGFVLPKTKKGKKEVLHGEMPALDTLESGPSFVKKERDWVESA